jgi:hypothetical protein
MADTLPDTPPDKMAGTSLKGSSRNRLLMLEDTARKITGRHSYQNSGQKGRQAYCFVG